jgi:hypothetical protein
MPPSDFESVVQGPPLRGARRCTGWSLCRSVRLAPVQHNGTFGLFLIPRSTAPLPAAVRGVATFDPLRHSVLALERATSFGLFERPRLARLHRATLARGILCQLVVDLWATGARCKHHYADDM